MEVSETISHHPDSVLVALRDRVQSLTEHMPNIESMEPIERDERPPVVYMHNRWRGSKDSFPVIARPFLTRGIVSWFDHAEWNEQTRSCSWRIEAVRARSIYECRGSTELALEGERHCRFTLKANLELFLERVPGLPKFLARRATGPVERFVASSMRPNLAGLARAVQEYLDSAGSSALAS